MKSLRTKWAYLTKPWLTWKLWKLRRQLLDLARLENTLSFLIVWTEIPGETSCESTAFRARRSVQSLRSSISLEIFSLIHEIFKGRFGPHANRYEEYGKAMSLESIEKSRS